MNRRIILRVVAAAFACLAPSILLGQSQPNWPYGYVPTAGQWNQWFALKQDLLNYTPINKAGDVMLGPLVTAAPTAAAAGFNLSSGASPTSPNNGDLWTTTTGFWLRINNNTINLLGGVSVNYSAANGGLEAFLPVQSVTTTSKSFSSSDLFKETRRANSGTAMTDTFPCATASGMANGASIQLNNVDVSANDTVSACAGTTINGASSVVIGPGRSTKWIYDPTATNWRPTMNSLTSLLSANNLSDVASASAALANLGGLPLSGGTMTGKLVTKASTTTSAGFNLPHGTAPTSPVNGDCWTTTLGLYCYINGSTVGPYSTGTGVTSLNSLVGALTLSPNGGATIASSGSTITIASPGGMLNRFRNSPMDVDQRGATITPAATNTYTLDGWIIYYNGSGCALSVTQQTGPQNGADHFLQVAYTSGTCSDVKIGQRIESSVAAPLAGKQVTTQFQFKQTTGGSVTPNVISCYAGATAADNFNGTSGSYCGNNNTFTTVDLASTSLSAAVSGTWTSEAYSWVANASAYKGYEIDFDLGALTTGQTVAIATPDIRVTPGVATGSVANPPPPELRPIQPELAFCQRYYFTGTALSVFNNGAAAAAIMSPILFPVQVRVAASPTNTTNSGGATFNTGGTGFAQWVVSGVSASSAANAGTITYTGEL